MSVTMDLGKVGVLYKGEHDSTQTYEKNDIVMANGSGYIAVQNVPVGVSVNDTDYWGVVVLGADDNVFATKAFAADTYALKSSVGSPLVASTVADMDDTDKVYVYVGSETGYTAGSWYYYDGVAWVSGGTYNSQGIGDGTVTTAKIANEAVTDEKLASDGVLSTVDELYDAIGHETITVDLTSAYTTGQYWNSQSTTAVIQTVSSYSSFAPIEVTPGRRYKAHVRGGSSSKQYPLLFVDGNYTILEHSTRPGGATVMDIEGIVPTGAVYALLTANTTVITTLDAQYYNEYYDVVTDVPAIESTVEKLSAGTMDMLGKTVAILGDSISTNGNYSDDNPFGNVPEIVIGAEDVGVTLSAYVTEYDVGTVVGGHEILESEIGTELTFTPVVADVGKYVGVPLTYNSASRHVWWEVMQEKLGFTPIAVCWSGASITSHEGSKSEYATSYAWHEAQIRKCGIRTPGTMQRVAPDVIIIYRGTNDMTHAKYARLTADYFAPYNWQYPVTDGLANDGFGFKEGISLTVKKLREAYPSAKIFLCTLNVFKRINYSHFPTNNGYNSLPQFNDAIREAADFFGIPVIDFAKDGITFENMEEDGYITESGKTHPSDKGHRVMGYKALKDFMAQNNSMA